MDRRRAEGLLYAALTVLIFAGWFVVTRFAVTRTLRPADIAVIRFGVGLLCLFPVLLRPLPPGAWRNGAVLALFWGTPFVLLLGYGLQHSSAADASAVTPTMTPVFAGLIAWAALGQRPGRARLLGYAAISAGVLLLVASHAGGAAAVEPLGAAGLVGASVSWSVYTLLFRRTGLGPLQAAALICFWSTAAFVPPYLLLGLSRLSGAGWTELAGQAAYQGVLMSAVGIVTFNRAVVLLGPGAASAVIALLPLVAGALAVPALGEVPTPPALLAILVVAGGVLLAARRPGPG